MSIYYYGHIKHCESIKITKKYTHPLQDRGYFCGMRVKGWEKGNGRSTKGTWTISEIFSFFLKKDRGRHGKILTLLNMDGTQVVSYNIAFFPVI